jgi:UDP-N-acetylglucosamine 2-epimerase
MTAYRHKPLRVLVALGTRPEIIKLAPVCHALERLGHVAVDVFWTGQHIDLAAGLLDFFGLKARYGGDDSVISKPGLAGKLAEICAQIEAALKSEAYDYVVVQGDTTTATAAAIAGFLTQTPVAHVEAGLRTGDLSSPWPEEFNRRVISLATKLHFAPTARSAENLRREGVADDAIFVVGNSVVDALLYARARVGGDYSPIEPRLAALPPDKKLIVATTHRRENIGDPMSEILSALRSLSEDGDKIVALPVHLNPEVRQQVLRALGDAPNVWLLPPLQYPDFVRLLSQAWCVVSDSGGIQEEAPAFGLPILITRESTERPEVVESGFGELVGSDCAAILRGVRKLMEGDRPTLTGRVNPFGSGDSGERIAAIIAGRSAEARHAS